MEYVITPEERQLFKRCRRAWDLGSRHRQSWVPLPRVEGPDLGAALGRALDVYYFPGMWDWNRVIVRPLVFSGLTDALREQRSADAEVAGGEGPDAEWEAATRRGTRILEQYFEQAPAIDRFTPMRVATSVEIGVPDRHHPGQDLVVNGEEVRFIARVPMLVVDEADRYWLVDHHMAGSIGDPELLKLDERAASYCWAWEQYFQGMRIAGVMYNELLDLEHPGGAPAGAVPGGAEAPVAPTPPLASPPTPATPQAAAPSPAPPGGAHAGPLPGGAHAGPLPGGAHAGPLPGGQPPVAAPLGGASSDSVTTFGHRRMYVQSGDDAELSITRETVGPIRRTWVPRTARELANWGEQLQLEAVEMTEPGIRVFPTPSLASCASCAYRSPCIAMNEGTDVEAVLSASYRKRTSREEQLEGRSGGSVRAGRGAAPPKFGLRPR